MWSVASELNDSMISGLAAYYSAQPPAHAQSGDAKLVAAGKSIFEKGMPDQGIPACNLCHGAKGEGKSMYPRLAGQHAAYLLKQILLIQNAPRVAPVMHGVIKDLTRDEMLAVTAYVASIGPLEIRPFGASLRADAAVDLELAAGEGILLNWNIAVQVSYR